MSDYSNQHHDDFEASVVAGLDSAIKNGRKRDRKQAIIYVLVVALLVGLVWFAGETGTRYVRDRNRFEAAVNRNCQTTKTNTESFNNFVWTIIHTTKSSTVLTRPEIAERVDQYQALYQTVPYCPPLRK